MYKLIIKDKQYQFFKHYNRQGYVKVCATSDQVKLTDYIENELPHTPKSIMQNIGINIVDALKDMITMNHNTAEFGVRGYYTVSYKV